MFAGRLTGSADPYHGRSPWASINFITAHDGFTLRDLVSYNEKHNEANLEANQDGTDDNRSWNCGAEGETDDPAILELRGRQTRNYIVTLLLSQGRVVSGLAGLLVRLGTRAPPGADARVHQARDPAAPGTPGLPPAAVPLRAADRRRARWGDHARAPRRLPGEGAARGEDDVELDPAGRGPRRAVQEWAWGLVPDPDVLALAERARSEGERAALGQTLLKLTTPGAPDVYQGDELWTLALVDPVNRRPVDWGARRAALDAVLAGEAPTRETAKLHLIHRALALRVCQADAFGPSGAYTPLDAGPGVCSFTRGIAEVLVLAPVRGWEEAGLAVPEGLRGRWRCALSDAPIELGASVEIPRLLVAPYGVALLERG